jgi:hypothetical protein
MQFLYHFDWNSHVDIFLEGQFREFRSRLQGERLDSWKGHNAQDIEFVFSS